MDIRLGSRVVGLDGQDVGKVDRVVLDPDTKMVVEIIVHQGVLLTKDRIVEVGLIESVDAEGTVHLSRTAAEVDRLPIFIERAYIVPTASDLHELPYPISGEVAAAGQVMPMLWRSTYVGEGYHEVGRSLLESVPVDAPPIVIESNVPEDLVSIDAGSAVYDASGEPIGHVEDLLYDDDGRITGFIVRSGLLRRKETRVSIDQVDRLVGGSIRLRVGRAALDA